MRQDAVGKRRIRAGRRGKGACMPLSDERELQERVKISQDNKR